MSRPPGRSGCAGASPLVRLFTRRGFDRADHYPPMAEAAVPSGTGLNAPRLPYAGAWDIGGGIERPMSAPGERRHSNRGPVGRF
jgi:hypothetical protein